MLSVAARLRFEASESILSSLSLDSRLFDASVAPIGLYVSALIESRSILRAIAVRVVRSDRP